MHTVAWIFFIVYAICLSLITVYCLIQFGFLLVYLFYRRKHPYRSEFPDISPSELPHVTIQLPVYNEKYVVGRLIDRVVKMNYPKQLLQIQVLDDSTDDTLEISKARVKEYQTQGINIELIHRTDRNGYKAGALKNGLSTARGEFIAIFDADFLPEDDFLLKSIPFFKDKNIAVVQTRWEYINTDYSLITRLQALPLNVHFTIEQTARMAKKLFLQFNGTGGIWRKTAIRDAGGWNADTLTEDLDLSIRAQLKNWKIRYIEEIGSPSELPVEMNGFKSQQFRWMKGGAECARKLLPAIWKSDLGFSKKIMTTFYLLSSSVFLLVFIAAVMSVPAIFLGSYITSGMQWMKIFMVGWALIFPVYLAGNFNKAVNSRYSARDITEFLLLFPLLLSLSLGMSLHNAVAVWEGLRGKKSAFVRTPKFNITHSCDSVRKTAYVSGKMSFSTRTEYFMAFYFAVAIFAGFMYGNYSYLGVHILLFTGFAAIATLSWIHTIRNT